MPTSRQFMLASSIFCKLVGIQIERLFRIYLQALEVAQQMSHFGRLWLKLRHR